MVAFDANIFIYLIERNPDFVDAAKAALRPVLDGKEDGCASVLVMTEILSGQTVPDISFLDHPRIALIGVTPDIAVQAGKLRQSHPSLRTPDALHLATALNAGAKQFITNDKRLQKFDVGIDVVPLERFTGQK